MKHILEQLRAPGLIYYVTEVALNSDLSIACFAEHNEGQTHFILYGTSETKYLKFKLENLSGIFGVLQSKENFCFLRT